MKLVGLVGGVAHRPGEQHLAAEPDDADRPVQCVAAGDLFKTLCMHLVAARRQLADAEHEIAHRHADAKNAFSGLLKAWRSRSRCVQRKLNAANRVPGRAYLASLPGASLAHCPSR